KSVQNKLAKSVQNYLTVTTNNDIKELKLMRAYFKAYKNRQAAALYYKTIGTSFLSLVIFSVQAIMQGKITDQNILELFHPINSWGLIFSIVMISLYYFLLPHRGENRLNLVINILDECIDEKVHKSKK
ncbi:hypothetical protein, partial [Pseudoneobacillus sp. C159]